jgi:tRNA A-37 threonylcarbamoyl transferase component Bud32
MSEQDPYANTMAAEESDGLAATVTAQRSAAGGEQEQGAIPIGATRFERGAELGRGGMGVVYTALDRQFNREVALKRLRGEAHDVSSIERFGTECLITGNLAHPGIPAVYERGEINGSPFYAMQRVKGRTLKEALAEAETLEQRLLLVPAIGRVAQTLAYAHSNGVVHRDIKPSNVVVGDYGETFVLDWGIAKVRGIAGDSAVASATGDGAVASTQIGQVVGTPAYMAPEQASGRIDAIDERTDVFAVGALLYHLLTGRAPYDGCSADDAISRAKRGDYEPIHQAARRAPKVLRGICGRAMEVQPAERYRSAADVAAAIDRFTNEAVAHQDTGPVGWTARIITVLTGVLALVGIGGVVTAATTFREAGWPAYVTMTLAVAGLSIAILEYATRGAYRLNAFVLALAACTFINGIAGTTAGLDIAYSAAVQDTGDAEKFRFLFLEGTREAISNIRIASALTVSQILAWAIARRRATAA